MKKEIRRPIPGYEKYEISTFAKIRHAERYASRLAAVLRNNDENIAQDLACLAAQVSTRLITSKTGVQDLFVYLFKTSRKSDGSLQRGRELVRVLMTKTFPEMIKNHKKVQEMQSPIRGHKDGDKANCQVDNLYRYEQEANPAFKPAGNSLSKEQTKKVKKMLIAGTYSYAEIAKKIGIPFDDAGRMHIYRIRKKLEAKGDIEATKRNLLSEKQLEQLVDELLYMFEHGGSQTDIATKLGLSTPQVSRWKVKLFGEDTSAYGPHNGMSPGRKQIPEETIIAIIEYWGKGHTLQQTANQFGVSVSTVHKAVNEKL